MTICFPYLTLACCAQPWMHCFLLHMHTQRPTSHDLQRYSSRSRRRQRWEARPVRMSRKGPGSNWGRSGIALRQTPTPSSHCVMCFSTRFREPGKGAGTMVSAIRLTRPSVCYTLGWHGWKGLVVSVRLQERVIGVPCSAGSIEFTLKTRRLGLRTNSIHRTVWALVTDAQQANDGNAP